MTQGNTFELSGLHCRIRFCNLKFNENILTQSFVKIICGGTGEEKTWISSLGMNFMLKDTSDGPPCKIECMYWRDSEFI